jgi:transcriptional regulator with XRE-family HTH domain
MTFGEKLRSIRIAQDLSQIELAEKAGINTRMIYCYEQKGTLPKTSVLQRLAESLNVSTSYLLDEQEAENTSDDFEKIFVARAKKGFGYKGAKEAKEVYTRAAALFAGGELDQKAKEVFFQSLLDVFLASMKESSEKYSPKKRASKKKKA